MLCYYVNKILLLIKHYFSQVFPIAYIWWKKKVKLNILTLYKLCEEKLLLFNLKSLWVCTIKNFELLLPKCTATQTIKYQWAVLQRWIMFWFVITHLITKWENFKILFYNEIIIIFDMCRSPFQRLVKKRF